MIPGRSHCEFLFIAHTQSKTDKQMKKEKSNLRRGGGGRLEEEKRFKRKTNSNKEKTIGQII